MKEQLQRGNGPLWQRSLYLAYVLIMLSLTILSAYAQEDQQRTAANDLNEFDVASSCYGAEYSYEPGPIAQNDASKHDRPESRFGYINLPAGQNAGRPEFVYITSRYYVHVGPYGDPGGCEFRRYLYRLKESNLFRREQVNENGFSRIKTELELGRRAYERSNPGKIFGKPELEASDSVGDCLFPIHWYTLRGQDYALLSIVHGNAGIVEYVVPHYE